MLKFYFSGAPNPTKVALFLEEAGLPYEPIAVDTRKGEQLKPAFLAINPNGKVPAIVDGDVTVFDSNAILLYLAEKTGKFLPPNTPAARGELLSWLMFVATGIGPYSGQAVHFKHHAPEKIAYAHNRYQFEVKRHYAILDARLGQAPLHGGRHLHDRRHVPVGLGAHGARSSWAKTPGPSSPTSSGWSTRSTRGPRRPAVALKDKYTFKAEMDDEARRHMFRHLKRAS